VVGVPEKLPLEAKMVVLVSQSEMFINYDWSYKLLALIMTLGPSMSMYNKLC
jgi:hypothetical protein